METIDVCCSLCGQNNYAVLYPATMNGEAVAVEAFKCTNPGYGHHPQIVRCGNCGFVYANPRWNPEELLQAYTAVEDDTYLTERAGRELTFRKHLQAMERVTGPANGRSLLDVGAYIGVFVEVAQAAGWVAQGIEPSAWAADVARQQGLNVRQGTQDLLLGGSEHFDIVTMWDVIEHVDDPSAEMAKAAKLLKPEGWLVLHTMDVSSLTARLMGSSWPWYMDMHLHYFSSETMAKMLQQNGFIVKWSGTQGRYLRMGYLASRVAAWNGGLGKLAHGFVNTLRLQETAVPVNFGDLFTVYAQKL